MHLLADFYSLCFEVFAYILTYQVIVFKGSHTLLAGLLYRGTVGFSRAQTVMILSNRRVGTGSKN